MIQENYINLRVVFVNISAKSRDKFKCQTQKSNVGGLQEV
jgi:hypothetical protein